MWYVRAVTPPAQGRPFSIAAALDGSLGERLVDGSRTLAVADLAVVALRDAEQAAQKVAAIIFAAGVLRAEAARAVAVSATMVQLWQGQLTQLKALAGGLRSPDPRAKLNCRRAAGAVNEILRAECGAWTTRPLAALKALAKSGNEVLSQLLEAILTVLHALSLVTYTVLAVLRADLAVKQSERQDDEAVPLAKTITTILARPIRPRAPAF